MQEEIERRCPEILTLGLLSEVGTRTARVKEIQRFLSFHHKTLQEFSASKHVVKTLDECSDKKVCYLGDVRPKRGGDQSIVWQFFCRKLAEKERICTERGVHP